MSEYAAFVGFDWADKKHDICLVEVVLQELIISYNQTLSTSEK